MEGTLYKILRTIEKPTPINNLSETTSDITVVIHKNSTPKTINITTLGPFHTIEDLARAIWLKENDDELFPKYSFLCNKDESGKYYPAMGSWVQENQDAILLLPNPVDIISSGQIQEEFVDPDGKKNISIYFPSRGRTTLEDAYLSTYYTMPEFHIFSIQYLLNLYTGSVPISERDWYGLFYPYFPHLGSNSFYMTEKDKILSKQIKLYIEAKQNELTILNMLLESIELTELKTSGVKYISFLWDENVEGFEGADTLFYIAPVDDDRPYMRLLSPNSTPLTKLYQPDPLQPPVINDITLIKTWIQDKAPDITENCLFTKVVVRNGSLGLPPLYGTLILFDSGNAKFEIQPPRDVRQLDFPTDLYNLGKVISDISIDMPYSLEKVKLGKANITVDLEFKTLPPKDIRKNVAKRLALLGTIFQNISPPQGQPKPLFMLRYKNVTNFVREDNISEFLTYFINRKGLGDVQNYVKDIAKEFEISEDDALKYISDYFEKRKEVTISNPETKEFVPLNSPGTDIYIVSKNVSTFSFQIYNINSQNDLIRIITILSAVFLGSDDDWDYVLESSKELNVNAESIDEAESQVLESSLVQESMVRSDFEPQASIKFLQGLEEVEEDEEEAEEEKQPERELQERKPELDAPLQKIVINKWFITRLQKIDTRLFVYKHPIGSKVRPYSTQCAANEDRYPSVMTHDQYLRMRSIYSEAESENKVGFIIYGIPETSQTVKDSAGKIEKFTVLRYGSNPSNPNYYMCSEFYCLRDLLPILKADWNSTSDHNGDPKPVHSCPFCHGRVIVDPSNPDETETVLQRMVKPKSTLLKRHLFIGFLKDGKHPNGFELPCCFIKEKTIEWNDNRFKSLRDATKSTNVRRETAISDINLQKELENELKLRTQQLVSYDVLKYRLNREYVLGPEKYPLEPGKVGVPNVSLDNYFAQDSSTFIARTSTRQEFKPTAQGMVRIGVLNKITLIKQSLFAALSPILGKNTIQEVARHFSSLITPRVFINLNFGNLLLEFFNPSDPEPSSSELASWAQIHLGINNPGAEYEWSRFYRSYHRFRKYINDPEKTKQLRHFVHALAEPDLLAPRGLTIITLEYTNDPKQPTTNIKVKCPSLGYDINRYSNNSLAFLTYHSSGIWEPLMYIDKIIKKDTTPSEQEGYYSIPYEEILSVNFPPVIKERYLEFTRECRSSYRGAYTYQSGIDNRVLLPLTNALNLLQKYSIIGVVRDSYNHIIAITIAGKTGEIMIPIVDDGNSFHNNTGLRIHIGLQTIELADANDTFNIYKNIITPLLAPISSIYIIDTFYKSNDVFGFRLGDEKAFINLPCSNTEEFDGPIEEIDNFEFEYMLNRKISMYNPRESDLKKSPYLLQKETMEDIYQHLRLTFSNWIALNSEGSSLRSKVQKLIERNDIPTFEKIRRLEIDFEPILVSWLSPDPNSFEITPVLLRSDCTKITDPEKCSGYCTMSEGQCKIHVPEIYQVSTDKRVDTVKYLITRLFDEIVRIPARSSELLHKGVKRIQVPSTNIHIDKQWIIPENVPAWYDLLKIKEEVNIEEPQYYEEFSRENTDNSIYPLNIFELPDSIKELVPEESKLSLRVIGSIPKYFGLDYDIFDPLKTIGDISRKIKKPVIQIYLEATPINIIGITYRLLSLNMACLVIVPDFENGPAILVTKDSMNDYVPGGYIKGEIYDSIKYVGPRVIRRKETVKPVESNSDSDSSNSEPNVELPKTLRVISLKPKLETPKLETPKTLRVISLRPKPINS